MAGWTPPTRFEELESPMGFGFSRENVMARILRQLDADEYAALCRNLG